MAPAWYMTTDGHWFPETAVVDASLCDVPVHCPVDVDPTGPGSGPRNDDTPTKLLDDATSDTFLVGFAVNGIAGIPSTWCCVDGDVLNGPGGVLKGTLDGPTRVILVDSTEDGGWHEILIDGPIGDGWVQTVQFLPSALEDCERDEVECPRTSIMGTQLDEEGNTLYICCVEVTNANGAVEYMPVLVDPTNIDGLVFVDAELCEQVVECPIPGSIISDNDPLTCCVSFGEAGFDIVTLTGNVRIGENGEPEYEATDGVWYQDFADAGRCTGGSTPCNGQLLASGECCESPNEVFQGQCVPPCPAGQQRNANGVCETPRQPEPTPCPTGQVRNANGVCVVPACPDEDKDGICDADDNCVFNPNENQTDSDNDGSGDPCDPCTDADQDLFCEIPGTPANDNCWGIYNPDQTDRDGDGVGDACDNCPTVQNADQTNTDGIGPGDECEEPECPRDANGGNGDLDGDGVCNSDDNCVRVANPNQEDRDDLDGWGDACDNCPDTYNPDQADTFGEPGVGDKCEQQQCPNGTASVPPDLDNDGVCNSDDNCPNNANPGQADSDGDNRGDVCDFCPGANGNVPTPNTPNPSPGYLYDTDNNGVLDSCFPGTGSFTNN